MDKEDVVQKKKKTTTKKRRCGTYIQWTITQPLKKNEVMSFAATWMDLEIIILSEVRQRKTNIM